MKKKSLTKKSLPIIAASVASVGFAVSSAVNAADLDTAKLDQGIEAIDSKPLEEVKKESTENSLETMDLNEGLKNEEYSIKIDVKGEGTVSPEGLKTARKGENVLLTITPGAGHKLESFKINGKNISLTNMSISGSESFSYTIQNAEEDYKVEAVFGEIASNLEALSSEISETQDLESPYPLGNMQEDKALAANASIGTTFSLNGLDYKVTSANEVELTGPKNFSGTLSIPSSVSYDGSNYSVTSIGQSAFWGCSGLTGNLTIPNSVKSIGESAFRGCTGLTGDLTIPHSVTSIGGNAFISCSGLASLTISNGVESIGEYAFFSCKGFTGYLTIPGSVTSIGESAFGGCTGLNGKLTILNGVISIGDYAFHNCSGLTGDLTIPDSVTSIGRNAFAYCSSLNGKLTMSNNVESIGLQAFLDCRRLTGNLTIPNSVKSIDNSAFSGCRGLKYVKIEKKETATIGTNVFGSTPIRNGDNGAALYVYKGFKDSGGVSALGVPESVVHIIPEEAPAISNLSKKLKNGHPSFSWDASEVATTYKVERKKGSGSYVALQEKLTSPEFTDESVTFSEMSDYTYRITPYAYWNTNPASDDPYGNEAPLVGTATETQINRQFNDGKLVYEIQNENEVSVVSYVAGKLSGELSIPKSVTEYGTDFSVTSIGSYAFQNCTTITGTLTIPDSIKSIGENAFYSCRGLTSLVMSEGITSIGYAAFRECENLISNLTIPSSVTSIGGYAFAYCGLTGNLTIPGSVKSIEGNAFYSCRNLTSLTISNGVTSIEYSAFNYCTSLTGNLTIPSSVESIGENAFRLCRGLTNLVMSEGVTSIGNSAFSDCSGLTGNLTIPNSVEHIGDGAFYGCSSLNGTLTIPNSVTSIGNSAFLGCSSLNGTLTIPNSVERIGDGAFYGCSSLTSVTIPNSVTSIEESAFNGCNSLESMTIPSSVETIGPYMFVNSTNLKYVKIERKEAATIGNFVFSGTPIGKENPGAALYVYKGFKDSGGVSALGVPEKVVHVIPEEAPGEISSMKLDVVDGKLKLSWDAARGANAYEITREIGGGSQETLERKYKSTEFIDESIVPLESHKTYTYSLTPYAYYNPDAEENDPYGNEFIMGKKMSISTTLNDIKVPSYDNGSIKLEKNIAQQGDDITFEVVPNELYVLKPGSLKVNGSSEGIKDNGDGTYTFIMPGEDIDIDAEFVKEFPELSKKDESTGVIIEVPEGAVPYGSYVYIEEVDESHANYEMIWENLDDEIEKVVEKSKFYIIEIRDVNGQKIQPNEGYKVKIYIPIPEEYDIPELQALRVESEKDVHYEGTAEEIEGKNYFVFETDHFSDYGVIDKNFNDIKASNEPDNGGKLELDESRVLIGEEVTIEVIPDEGYILKPGSLKINGSSEGIKDNGDGTYTFIMPGEDIDIDAEFVKEFPELSIKDENTGIKIEVPEGALPYGSSIFITEIKKENENYESVWKNLDEDVKENIGELKFYNIEARDSNGNSVLLNKGYSAKFYIPVLEDFNLDTLKVLLIESGKDLNYSANIEVIDGKKYAVFESDRFGYYGILDELKKDLNNDVIINNDNDDNDTSNEINEGNEDNKNSSSSDEVYQKTSDERITPIIISLFSALISGIGCIISYFKKFLKSDNSK